MIAKLPLEIEMDNLDRVQTWTCQDIRGGHWWRPVQHISWSNTTSGSLSVLNDKKNQARIALLGLSLIYEWIWLDRWSRTRMQFNCILIDFITLNAFGLFFCKVNDSIISAHNNYDIIAEDKYRTSLLVIVQDIWHAASVIWDINENTTHLCWIYMFRWTRSGPRDHTEVSWMTLEESPQTLEDPSSTRRLFHD